MILDQFHPAVRTWFERRFAFPSRAQELGWPVIAGADLAPRHDVLLCAPTGSGKTLAAFLWAIDRLVRDAARGALCDEVSVLYVSPLKALANDIRINLDEPLDGVRAAGREMGLDLSAIRAGLRTGDTQARERSAMLRRPPQILVTTPESLFILLTSPRFREKLKAVRHVIVDELHAVAGNKRGAHLALTLERLDRMIRLAGGARPARIGLSATLNPIETLGEFLAGFDVDADGARSARPVQIVRADDPRRRMDLQVIAPGPELGAIATHEHWEAMYDEAAKLVEAHRTTLIFTLSRRWAERVAFNLQKRLGAGAVMAHHGSLARKERHLAEQRLKHGELKAIVATSSLELGIDVGAVELVCQLDSPKSISAAIQRIGRSGHSLGGTPKGRLFALTLDDLLECAAAVRAIRRGDLDEVEIPSGCLDVAAQQVIAIAAEEGEIPEAELLRLLRGAFNFGTLDSKSLRGLLEQMARELPKRIQGAAPKIFLDAANRRVRPRRAARLAAITSGGTIPENGNYDVVIESEGRKIGDVEEDFAQESSRGDVFMLGSMPWQILGISRGRLMVEPAPGMAPSLPFWQTEAAGRSYALSAEVTELRRTIADRLPEPAQAVRWLIEDCALNERAAAQAVDYVRRGMAALGAIPDERTIVVERFFDGLGGTQIVIHAPLGIRFNRGLGLALRKRLCQSFDFEIQASAIDDGCLLALNSRHSFPLTDLLAMVPARRVRDVLVQAMLNAPMFEVRFRHVASRALMVMRWLGGRRVPAWIQRLRAQELAAAIFPGQQACFENRPPEIEIPGHFIVAEAIRECLQESADAERMTRVLKGIEDGSIRTVMVDSVAPSVFAHRLLLAWDYSFLDGGERANRRSRTVQMNRAMAEDVFRTEDLSAMLAADAVDAVAAEATGLAPGRRARNRDELCELIRAHGALASEAIALRAGEDGAAMVAALEAEGRIARARLRTGAAEVILAAEDIPIFAAAYPGANFNRPSPSVELPDPDGAREEIVRRALRTSGPVTPGEIAERLGFEIEEIEQALASLEAKGAIFRGHFTKAVAEQWCDRYNLERIHRITLARVRAEVEPAADREFAAFRLRWMHAGGDGITADPAGVFEILQQLSGLAFTPETWEQTILPARVPGYRPEMLDLACLGGDMMWVGVPAQGAADEIPARVTFVSRRRAPAFANGERACGDAKERAVLDALASGGAQYLDQVSERANLSERDTLAALWRLAAAGCVSNDSFAPLRMLASDRDAPAAIINGGARRPLTRHDAALRAKLKSSTAGRWSAIEASARTDRDFDQARELAMVLLERNGIVSREMLALESIPLSWGEISFALRRLELSGRIRRGWFVRSLSGEQYALPEAVDLLRAARNSNSAREKVIALSAADPANPYGAILPGCGIAREAGNIVVMRPGQPVLGLAGRALVTMGDLDEEGFAESVGAILAMRRRVLIETIDGAPALASPRVAAMAAMRFHSDGRALVYDGLPGPAPARAPRAPANRPA
ncbi:MAG TPA: crosslink repair DNA glycosylase YcaQ family protein [Candidatus Binataceae bacterium]|nr:crosslink repair DNA glycosylase YcaQ family protein [Candidatus Binataceae bacterium]